MRGWPFHSFTVFKVKCLRLLTPASELVWSVHCCTTRRSPYHMQHVFNCFAQYDLVDWVRCLVSYGFYQHRVRITEFRANITKIEEMKWIYHVGEIVILYICLRNTTDQHFSELDVDQESRGRLFTNVQRLCCVSRLWYGGGKSP